MTTKGLSQKQVIVPISIENTKYFISESSFYVININRALKGIKSNVIANFIHTNTKEIIIFINNIANLLDFQEIEKYVKNTLCTVTN